jgi:hypothetical protein
VIINFAAPLGIAPQEPIIVAATARPALLCFDPDN